MPEEQLKVSIQGDASGLDQASRQAVSSLNKIDKSAIDTAKTLDKIPQVSQKVSQAASVMASSAAKMGGAVKKGSNEATQSLVNLSRVAQDAPYGFIGIANNINPLLESFQRLKVETGSTKGALSALGTSLTGAGGLGLAVGIASSLLVVFGDKLFKSGKEASAAQQKIDAAKKSFDELKATTATDILGGAGSEFSKAVSVIETLRANIDLAKKGFIDKKQVVNEYNKELGDTIGKVQTLDEVEQTIAKKGEAYLRFTLLKAAAQEALKKASEAALLAAENEKKASDISTNAFIQAAQKTNQALGLTGATDNLNKSINKSVEGFKKTTNEANKQKDRFVDIFRDFQKQAADIANQNKFNFNPEFDNKGDKGDRFEFLFDFLPFDPNGKMKPEQRAKLIDSIVKFQKEFSGIIKGVGDLSIGSDEQRIQKAIQIDIKLKAGKIDLDLTRIKEETEKSLTPEDLLPNGIDFSESLKVLEDSQKTAISQFIRSTQNESERIKNLKLFSNLDFNISTDLGSQIDLFKTKLNQLGVQIPKAIEAVDIFGNPIVVTFDQLFDTSKISNKDALESLNKAFENIRKNVIYQKEQLQNAINEFAIGISIEGISSIGEAIGAALTGDDIGSVFKQFGQMLGGAVQALGKQIIALNVAALAVKKSLSLTFANPAIGIAAGITLVAVGSALKNLIGGGIKGFAKGGWVGGQGSGDTVPAMLTPGEFVVTKDKAPFVAGLLKALGSGIKFPKLFDNKFHFADGGFVPSVERTNPINQIKNIIQPARQEFPAYLPVIEMSYDKFRIIYSRSQKQKALFG